ncbi:hypothetical protein [Sporomusa sp. KB1]|uniref:hypothetical protein n=1 Tax=Sporomusa sp. KB1 TaxID=943346 RepID=UPI0011A8A97E|nr:hypothetical protein [Sporomusa sp. KB1]TWH49269.1 hypothetical protein Salpa_5479 [Sporomusa sp. KB1]
MTFGELIKDLTKLRDRNGEKVFRILRNKFAYQLLNASGIKDKKIELESVGKWIDRKVPDNISSYFPNGRINRSKVYRYFRFRLNKNNNWQIVQNNLYLRNDNGRFNCSNEDPEVFYQSLLDEFVESLGLPSSEEPDNDISMVNETPVLSAASLSSFNNAEGEIISQTETPSEQIRGIFKQAIQDYSMEDFIRYDPTVSLDDNLLARADNFLKTIETDIIAAYEQSHGQTLIYIKLVEFYHELKGYVSCLRLGFISYSPSYIRDSGRNTIKNLYYGICPDETRFEYRNTPQEMREPLFKRKAED